MKSTFKYLVICSLIMFLTQCNYRTSSQKRFSKTLDIEIPKNAEILKDEYQSNWQDFAINYELKLSKKQMFDLTKSIRDSKYYNPVAFQQLHSFGLRWSGPERVEKDYLN